MIIPDVDKYRVCEPVFECVRVALAQRGETFSPAYIQGISGAAFRVSGPCPCAPTCGFAMWTTDLIELLGYDYEAMKPTNEEARNPERVAEMVSRIKDEVRVGRSAIVWHAFTMAEWDVVCGFDDDQKEFIGRGSYRGLDGYVTDDEGRFVTGLDICPANGALFIGDRTREFDARSAELDALEEAIRHANAPRDVFLECGANSWRFREGLACYDAWIAAFREPGKKPDMGDRYCTRVFSSTHSMAPGFLRELAAKYPEAADPLERAAEQFAIDAEALHACIPLTRVNNNEDAADPHPNEIVATNLKRARNAYAAGIASIERALLILDYKRLESAQLRAGIKRGEGSAVIQRVPVLSWEGSQQCTFAGSLQATLKVTEQPWNYAEIMGLTGLGFRVRWANDATATKWCPSMAVGEMPDEIAAAGSRMGWPLTVRSEETESRDNDQLRKDIVASIDAGRCVLVYPGKWDVGLVYGYADEGEMLLVRDYHRGEKKTRIGVEGLLDLVFFLGDPVEADPRAVLKEALTAAAEGWKAERVDGGLKGREYWQGDAALGAWIGDLEGFHTLSDESRESLQKVDGWNMAALFDARKTVVPFLKEWSTFSGDKADDALKRAAELYKDEAELLRALVGPLEGKAPDWSAEGRQTRIDALTAARELETKAIAEIEAALAAMNEN